MMFAKSYRMSYYAIDFRNEKPTIFRRKGSSVIITRLNTPLICACLHIISRWLFHNGMLAPHYDWFHCVVNIPEDAVRVGEPIEGEQMTTLTSGKLNLLRKSFPRTLSQELR
jgi:hypothetical protein